MVIATIQSPRLATADVAGDSKHDNDKEGDDYVVDPTEDAYMMESQAKVKKVSPLVDTSFLN